MKTVIAILLNLLLILPVARSQESNKSRLAFGFNAGVAQNANGYRFTTDNNGFNYYEGGLHFTSGFNLSYFVTERFRPRFEFRYSEMKYGFNWSEIYSQFDYTESKLNMIDLNLNFDYLVLGGKKFQLFLSPGIVTEFNTGKTNRNYLYDGTSNIRNFSVITDQFPSSIAGANFSVLAKYNLNENFGFTLTPGYNYYFKNFVESNDKSYTRTLLNFGIEYTF